MRCLKRHLTRRIWHLLQLPTRSEVKCGTTNNHLISGSQRFNSDG